MQSSDQIETKGISTAIPLRRRHCLSIGGVTLGISVLGDQSLCLSSDHQKFSIADCSCDIEIEVEKVGHLPAVTGRKLFDSGAVWSLQTSGSDLVFDFNSPITGSQPYK